MTDQDRTSAEAADAGVWTPPPWEPPLAGTEVEHLLGALRRMRTTFRWKAGDLDEAGLRHRIDSSALTLGGLLLHLAANEDLLTATKLRGEEVGDPWRAMQHDGSNDWEMDAGTRLPASEVYAIYDATARRTDERVAAAIDEGGLDLVAHVDDGNGNHGTLRRLLFDLLEEYGRHTGHADLLREAYDGRVGEDPPDDWTP